MLNIVVPMAGKGSRFQEKGYTFPKPLIEIGNKPMIQVVVENLRPKVEHRFVFICQKAHYDKYALQSLLSLMAPGCKIIVTDGTTQGAACTVMLAKQYIDGDDDLMIANSDQYVDIDMDQFISTARGSGTDGCIMTFNSTHPKWSFAKRDKDGFVIETAEKKPISNEATVGIYYFRHGRDFVGAAESMIAKDIRTNNEFYVCPVYNQMILKGRKISTHLIRYEDMHGLGTPEDLEIFLKSPIMSKLSNS